MLKIHKIFVVLFCTFISFNIANAQDVKLVPKLKLPSDNLNYIFLDNKLFEDSNIIRIKDNLDEEGTLTEINELKSDLSRAKKQRKTQILGTLCQKYLKLTYYYNDILNDEIESYAISKVEASKKFKEALHNLKHYTKEYAKFEKTPALKDQALYYHYISDYFLSKNISRTVNNLDNLKNLNNTLRTKVSLLKAIHKLEYTKGKETIEAINSLVNLSKKESTENRIIINFIIARSLAGLNYNGIKTKNSSSIYKQYLYQATKLAVNLNQQQKTKMFELAVNIWIKAEGKNINWQEVPIYMQGYTNLELAKAIQERQAISYFNKHDYNKSFAIYKKLSQEYYNTDFMIEFDKSLISICYSQYLSSKSLSKYESLLSSLIDKYQVKENFVDTIHNKIVLMQKYLHTLYKNLVFKHINVAKTSKATLRERLQAIELANKYLTFNISASEKSQILFEIANIYYMNKQYAQSVEIYTDLATQTSNIQQKQKYLLYAIRSQNMLAHWPQNNPWREVKANISNVSYASQRTMLVNIYAKLLETNPSNSEWIVHLGLLKINLEQKDEAFDLWTKSIDKYANVSDKNWALMSGYILTSYLNDKNWQKLEDFSKLCLSKNIIPLYFGKTLNLRELIATALFEGAKQALDQKQYKIAIQKFNEFITSYSIATKLAQAHYLLAHAYKGDAQHQKALEEIYIISQSYKQSPSYKPALYKGVEWAMDMALEDRAILFAKLYLDKFYNTKDSVTVREHLINLTLAKGFYDVAISLIEEQIQSSYITKEQKINLIKQVLELKQTYDSLDNAFYYTTKLDKSLINSDDDLKIKILTIRIEYYYSKGNFNALKKLEKELLDINNPIIVKDPLSMVRFIIANHQLEQIREEIFSLELKNPLEEIKHNFHLYNTIKAKFDLVCEGEPKGVYCPKALFTVARSAEKFISLLENINIADTLDDKTVNTFISVKDKILETLSADLLSYDEKAYDISKGGTLPQFADEILWNYRLDFNLISLQNDTSNGYVQINIQ